MISVRQAVLSDLDDLAPLFDQYRQFQGKRATSPLHVSFFARGSITGSRSYLSRLTAQLLWVSLSSTRPSHPFHYPASSF
jgi:hypothetical protein